MNKIWFTSDLHFCHDKDFLYIPRGFSTIEEHDETILNNYNSVIDDEDDVYILGDLMLGNQEKGLEYLKKLKGKIHIIRGNHCTNTKWEKYKELPNVVELIGWATVIKYKKYNFYLSHFPTFTANFDDEYPRQCLINLFGHTHQTTNFFNDTFGMYHVGLDSHNCYPILLDDIIEDIKIKFNKEREEYERTDL